MRISGLQKKAQDLIDEALTQARKLQHEKESSEAMTKEADVSCSYPLPLSLFLALVFAILIYQLLNNNGSIISLGGGYLNLK